MSKDLFEFFQDAFDKNLPITSSYQEAFDKTNKDLGFTAYTSLKSFRVQRAKRGRAIKPSR